MIYVLLPLINLYVLFYLTNCMMKEEVFSKTAELVRDIFSWGAKLVLTSRKQVLTCGASPGLSTFFATYAAIWTVRLSLFHIRNAFSPSRMRL